MSSIRAPHLALHEQARRGDDDRIGEHNVGSNGPEVGPRLDAIFPAIAEYAFLSDCENNCLISPTGAVEWLCLPRPHDPSVFGTILDRSAGSFRLGPTDTAVPASRRYLPGTNILESTWQTRTGWLVVQDFLAVGPWHRTTDRSSLHRRTPGDFDAQHVLVRYATCLYESLRQTECFWREWIGGGNFPDRPWRERLQRSALTLKGLTYCSTGALLAAATTSLPEYPGGARNWDYRYTWVRDASFTLWALHALGFDAEADDFLAFLADVIVPLGPSGNGQSAAKVPIGPEPSRFQVLYGVDGTRECPESELDHLSGYGGSRPVRIGNAAYSQEQFDIYGTLVDCVYQHTRSRDALSERSWRIVVGAVEAALSCWRRPDRGIWEVRGEPRHFTSSKVMCWVAADRGARLAALRGDRERATRWSTAAAEIHADVLEHGVDQRGRFTQSYDSPGLDASLLLLPLMRFCLRRTRGFGRPFSPSATSSATTGSSSATAPSQPMTGSRIPRRHSLPARSGSSRRSWRSARPPGHANCASACSALPAALVSTQSSSIPRRAGTSATSRKP